MALLDFPSGPATGETYTLNGNMWKWNGTSWVAFNSLSLSSQVTGILAVQYGGTGFGGTYTKGDILYATSSNTFSKLAAGSAGSILAIDVNKDLYWKVDDAGTGSVGAGTAWGFAYYNNSTNTITSGSGFSYISGTNNVVLTNGLLSLPGTAINSGVWAGTAISLANGGTNNNLSGVGQSYQLAFYNATGTAITALASGAGIANSILLQASNSSTPTWVGQSTLSVGLATSTSNKVNVTTFTGAGTSYLYFGDVVSGYATIGATADITIIAQSGTINAKFFSGTATSAAQVNTDNSASSSVRYLVGTVLNSASGSTQLSTGSGITFTNNLLTSAGIAVTGSTLSTSSSTGALVVTGGVGIGGSLNTATGNTSSISGVVHYNSVITGGTWAGTAVSLLYGGTNNNLSGVGQSYQLAFYNATGTAITALSSASVGNSVLLQANQQSAPTWVGQSSLSVGLATSTSNKVNVTTFTGAGTSYLYFGDVVSGYATIGATADITIVANTGTINAKFFSGTATSAAQVNTDNSASSSVRYLVGTVLNSASGSTQLSTGSGITFTNNLLTSAGIAVTGSTLSTSSSTGALIVTGGVGIGGSLNTATGNTSSISGVVHYNSVITSGTWAGTAVSLLYGGTNNTTSGNGYSSKVAVYNAAGTAITALTHTQGSVIFGATGGTYASIASTLLPVAAISATAPAAAGAIGETQAGQLWWDSEFGVLKVYYADGTSNQWVDATPVLGSSGGGSSTKRSYVMTFGAGFTPSTGADTVQILIPYAPDNTSKYYYIKRLDYRAETAGTGVSFFIERFTGGNAAFSVSTGNRIHSGAGASFVASSGTFTTSYTQSSSGASFVSSSGVAGSVISGDYLRLNFSHINSAATMSVSIILEEQ
jgi:fibronectin-binding autotransporter adhesin